MGGGPAMKTAKATRQETAAADETPNMPYIILSNHFQLIDLLLPLPSTSSHLSGKFPVDLHGSSARPLTD
jgi:hypothetical protein